jgi:hypothetical protein
MIASPWSILAWRLQAVERFVGFVGAMICKGDAERITLLAQAAAERLDRDQGAESASR